MDIKTSHVIQDPASIERDLSERQQNERLRHYNHIYKELKKVQFVLIAKPVCGLAHCKLNSSSCVLFAVNCSVY